MLFVVVMEGLRVKVDDRGVGNPSTGAAMARAKRWSRRVAAARSAPDQRRCVRQCLMALYSTLPPKRDGSHPLDAQQLKLEGE